MYTAGAVDMIKKMYPPFPTPEFVPNFTGYEEHWEGINWYEMQKSMSQLPEWTVFWVSSIVLFVTSITV